MLDQDALIHMVSSGSTCPVDPLTNKPGVQAYPFLIKRFWVYCNCMVHLHHLDHWSRNHPMNGTSSLFGFPLAVFVGSLVPLLHGGFFPGDPSKNSCDGWPILMRWMRNLSIRSFCTSCGLKGIAGQPHWKHIGVQQLGMGLPLRLRYVGFSTACDALIAHCKSLKFH